MSSAVKVDLVFLAAGLYTARAPFLAQLTSTQHWINSMINSVYLTQSSIPPVGYRTLDVSTAAAASSQNIAHFVLNFVAMATRMCRSKI